MAVNTQSNNYTFIYSSIIVVIVAIILAVLATSLRPKQERNVEIEKKQNILASMRIASTPQNAEELYKQYISKTYTLNHNGDTVADIDPFLINQRNELKKPRLQRNLPVFEAIKNDTTYIIIPVYGKGLWGPIWGYVAFQPQSGPVSDANIKYNSVYGSFFDHKGETPGLGAEIAYTPFQDQFSGKKIFNDAGEYVGIKVVKEADPSSPFEVDGISGGTITSKGVQAMLDTNLINYQNFFKSAN